jgi:uncharacterized UBP type Zn finger protein
VGLDGDDATTSKSNGSTATNHNDSNCNHHQPRRRKRIIVELQKLFAVLQRSQLQLQSESDRNVECSSNSNCNDNLNGVVLAQSLSTKSLTKSFGWEAAEAQDQHDINELYNLLLDGIEGQMPRHHQFLDKYYKGSVVNVIECLECNTARTRSEPFSQINVVLHGHHDLMSSLDAMYMDNVETLSGDNAYFCGHCNSKQNAKKYCRIETVPDVMVCNLNRFHYDLRTGERLKITQKFKFPKSLNLQPFLDRNDSESMSSMN